MCGKNNQSSDKKGENRGEDVERDKFQCIYTWKFYIYVLTYYLLVEATDISKGGYLTTRYIYQECLEYYTSHSRQLVRV